MNKELTDEELLYASEEDWEFYREAIDGLPTREGFKGNFLDKDNIEIPYGSGPHILKYFKKAINLSGCKSVLEIGFNLGHGAAMLLKLGMKVDSVDISTKWETFYAALFLMHRYKSNFTYFNRGVWPPPYGVYDMVFIDGAHDEASIVDDINLSKELNIPFLLLDDWLPKYGETQQAVAKFPELELVEDMNNLRLYKWKS